jgi:F-type H+-transporting ATPase subunit delta
MSINAVEGFPLEDFSADAVKAQIAEAQKVANGSGSEQDIAEAKIELEVSHIIYILAVLIYANHREQVLESLQAVLK